MPHTVEVENENFRQLLAQASQLSVILQLRYLPLLLLLVAAACCKFSAIDATATTETKATTAATTATWHYR